MLNNRSNGLTTRQQNSPTERERQTNSPTERHRERERERQAISLRPPYPSFFNYGEPGQVFLRICRRGFLLRLGPVPRFAPVAGALHILRPLSPTPIKRRFCAQPVRGVAESCPLEFGATPFRLFCIQRNIRPCLRTRRPEPSWRGGTLGKTTGL
jgi:hypothetical protein